MSEYSQIQTYIKSIPENFKCVIKRFAEVLESLGLDSKYFTTEQEWELLHTTWLGGDAEEQLFHNDGDQLHIRPYVTGWTPEVRKELQDTWLEVSLLFLTVEIENRIGQLKDEHKSLIWAMMEKFSKEFTESGVYFTNEATDGRPWEALICGENEDKWEFDAAILPENLSQIYKDYPTEMFININEKTTFVARKAIWRSAPWLTID
ncbi:hypothetical protein HQN89_28500 [Paenibacillus frigoriresistens]|uniref:hypothetical protein n=1 Tax=Paenibacillus alginolyticus TaxID=59839 RepID=UPI00156301C2|nr:hypothetical protein [Paenibacillus frigoriresistens]NRF94835.1 hypothetical protein [Paenibacillus frigoriresistens]